ncbi:MAG: hypothetical protein ACYC26_02060 [Phycisphaerales bacterium]
MLIRRPLPLVVVCCVLAAACPVVGDSGPVLGVIVAENAAPVADGFLAAFTPALVGRSFTLVDRSHIQKLIAEQSLSITGVMRDPLRLGQLIGAPYLIYLTADTTPAGSRVSLLLVEVASGNVLIESVQPWQPDQSAPVIAAARDIADAVALARKQSAVPAAAVLNVLDRGSSQRLRFFQTTIRGTLEQMLAQRGWRVLRRTHTDQLAKETTLSAAGLTHPDAEVLARAADLAVSVEFVEHPSSDLAFEQTPITLTLTIRRGEQTDTRTLNFTLQNTQPLHDDLAKAIPPAPGSTPAPGSASTDPAAKSPDNTGARLEAAHLMAQVDTNLYFVSTIGDHERRVELCRRIIYLDPTVKEAYFYLGMSLDAIGMRRDWLPTQQRMATYESCCEAFNSYLQFPRDDRDHVNQSFMYLLRNYEYLPYQARADQKKREQLFEQSIAISTDFARWCCATDWKGYYYEHQPIRMLRGTGFEAWWQAQPQRKAAFEAWVAEMAAKNPTLKKPGTFPIDLTPAPITAMYGDFFGDPPPPDMYRMCLNADWFMTNHFEAAEVPAADVSLPDGVKSTEFIARTPAGLWFVGSASNLGSPVPRGLALYHQPDESQPIQRIELPEVWLQCKTLGGKPMSAVVQVGDEIVWSAVRQARIGGPQSIPEKLFTYNVKNHTFAAYGVADGIPSDATCFVLPSADGRSAWLLSAGESSPYKSFLTRYQAGRFYLADKCDLQSSIGLLLTDQATFNLINGEMQVQIGGPEGRAMRTFVDGKTYTRLLPLPSYFGVGRSWMNGTAVCNNMVRAGDHVYVLGVGGGMLVFSTKGEIEHFWYPRTFWYWKELGGFLDGNCPLPPTNACQLIADDADPTRLWIVGRDHRKGASGVFITCFDTATQRWSSPQRVSGPIMLVQPFGEHLYLTGVGMKRVAKSAWKTDQVAPTGQPAIHTADTLFGKAAAALYAGDFAETRRLLTQAADRNIAADKAKRMLKDLDALEAKTASPEKKP